MDGLAGLRGRFGGRFGTEGGVNAVGAERRGVEVGWKSDSPIVMGGVVKVRG